MQPPTPRAIRQNARPMATMPMAQPIMSESTLKAITSGSSSSLMSIHRQPVGSGMLCPVRGHFSVSFQNIAEALFPPAIFDALVDHGRFGLNFGRFKQAEKRSLISPVHFRNEPANLVVGVIMENELTRPDVFKVH